MLAGRCRCSTEGPECALAVWTPGGRPESDSLSPGWTGRPPCPRAKDGRSRRETPPSRVARRRRWRVPIPPLPPPQRPLGLPTISAPRRRRREDKEKVRSDSPGDFHRLPPAPLLPSARPGPPPSCLISPGFSEKSQVTFFCPAGLVQSSRGEVAGPLGDERRAGREGACRAAQSVLERGGGEAPGASMSQLNIYTYTVVLAALPDSGAPGVHPCGAEDCGWGFRTL